MMSCAITAHLSPWWGYPPPALRCRSSGWCQRGGSSRSRPSHLPTASTGRRTPSGCCRALGSHGPLEEMDGRGERTEGSSDEGKFAERKGHKEGTEWSWGEESVMLGFVCWCFHFLPVVLILHNQLSVWVPAVLSRWGPTLSDVTLHCKHLCQCWVSLIHLEATPTVNVFQFLLLVI